MFLIAIDFGLSYLKICLIDKSGEEKLILKYDHRYTKDDGIYKEINLNYSFEKIIESIRKIKKIEPSCFNNIKSISVSTHGQTFVLIDKKGKELINGIYGLDRRAEVEAKEINSITDSKKNYTVSGINYFSEIFAIAKILWFKKNKKNIYNKIYKVLFLEDYIIFKLTGKFVTDKSIASISGMFDLLKNSWREDILNILGLKQNNFSEVYDAGTKVGEISDEFAEKTGLKNNVNVVAGMLDALANSLGSGNIKYGKAVECTGTALLLITNTSKPNYNTLKLHINYFVNNTYSLLVQSFTAGALIDWFGKNFYNIDNYYEIMEKDASKIKPLKNDIIFLPYFINAGTANNYINSRGLFFGIDLNSKKEHFCRSIYESIGFILKESILTLESITSSKIDSVLSVGGGSKSSFLSQTKSDILNKKIIVTKNKEVGCLGVTILSAVANNFYTNIEEACQNMIRIDKTYNPNSKLTSFYEERYKIFKEIFNNAKELFLKYY